jgi:myo-inositol-hexaphosphate 3-phosphohydrolase
VILGTDKKGGLALYDLAGGQLQYLPAGDFDNVDLRTGFRLGGRLYYLVTSKTGDVEQWELYERAGGVDGRRVRRFRLGSQTEGCVADDELGSLFLSEERQGTGGTTRSRTPADRARWWMGPTAPATSAPTSRA